MKACQKLILSGILFLFFVHILISECQKTTLLVHVIMKFSKHYYVCRISFYTLKDLFNTFVKGERILLFRLLDCDVFLFHVLEIRYGELSVAVKVLQRSDREEEQLKIEARFAREADMMSRVHHKNLVKVYNFWHQWSCLFKAYDGTKPLMSKILSKLCLCCDLLAIGLFLIASICFLVSYKSKAL